MKWNNFFIIHTSRPHSDINTLHACSFFNLPLTFSSSQSCIQYYNIKMKLEPPLFKIEFPYHVIFVTSTVCIDKWSLGTMWFFFLFSSTFSIFYWDDLCEFFRRREIYNTHLLVFNNGNDVCSCCRFRESSVICLYTYHVNFRWKGMN